MNVIFNLLMFESNVSIFSQFNSRRAKKMKRMQRDGIISTSFHSLWICVAMLVTCTGLSPVPNGNGGETHSNDYSSDLSNVVSQWIAGGALRNAVIAKYGIISEWDTSQVTKLYAVFANKDTFNEDLSKWDVSSVTTMYRGKFYCSIFSLSPSLSLSRKKTTS